MVPSRRRSTPRQHRRYLPPGYTTDRRQTTCRGSYPYIPYRSAPRNNHRLVALPGWRTSRGSRRQAGTSRRKAGWRTAIRRKTEPARVSPLIPGAADIQSLTITGVTSQTLYFADRPSRVTDAIPTTTFIDQSPFRRVAQSNELWCMGSFTKPNKHSSLRPANPSASGTGSSRKRSFLRRVAHSLTTRGAG